MGGSGSDSGGDGSFDKVSFGEDGGDDRGDGGSSDGGGGGCKDGKRGGGSEGKPGKNGSSGGSVGEGS